MGAKHTYSRMPRVCHGRSVENEAGNHWGRELEIVSPFISEKIISTIASALYEQNNRQ